MYKIKSIQKVIFIQQHFFFASNYDYFSYFWEPTFNLTVFLPGEEFPEFYSEISRKFPSSIGLLFFSYMISIIWWKSSWTFLPVLADTSNSYIPFYFHSFFFVSFESKILYVIKKYLFLRSILFATITTETDYYTCYLNICSHLSTFWKLVLFVTSYKIIAHWESRR